MAEQKARIYGVRRPEGQIELDIRKLDGYGRRTMIQSLHQTWAQMTPDCNEHFLQMPNWVLNYSGSQRKDNRDRSFELACDIIRPFKGRLKGEVRTKDLSVGTISGIFLSGLLNETEIDKVVLDGIWLRFLGYRVCSTAKHRKVIEVAEDLYSNELGLKSQGCLVINKGKASNMAAESTDGIWLNYGDASEGGHFRAGDYATSGIFVNFNGGVKDMSFSKSFGDGGIISRGVVYAGKRDGWETGATVKPPSCTFVEPDEHTIRMLEELERAGKGTDMQKVETLAETVRTRVLDEVRKQGCPK